MTMTMIITMIISLITFNSFLNNSVDGFMVNTGTINHVSMINTRKIFSSCTSRTLTKQTTSVPLSSSTASSTTTTTTTTTTRISTTRLYMSILKPAAIPLLDSGKAVARSGELFIDMTTDMELYGGGLSATGALIRNAGDAIAQAAASCRFKTALELVCDELREAGTCLKEGVDKLKVAVAEAKVDNDDQLVTTIETMMPILQSAGTSLEAIGECIIKKSSVNEMGQNMISCGTSLQQLSNQISNLSTDEGKKKINNDNTSNGLLSSQRMAYASERMIVAGNELLDTKPSSSKPKGKSWIKG